MSNSPISPTTELIGSRAYWGGWLVAAGLAVALAFVPLFNLVGYESAATFGVVLGLVAAGLTIHAVRSGRVDPPLAGERRRSPAEDFGRLGVVHLGLAVGPLVVLSLNGLRVPNCDWVEGFAFWGLIVGPAILIGQTTGWVATALAPDRRIAPWIVGLGLPVADGAVLVWHLATQPPIVGHQWLLGYFGGSIYDEALAVPTSLVAFRVLNILAVVAVVGAIQAIWKLRDGRRAHWTIALVAVAVIAGAVGFTQRAQFGIAIDRDHIVDELGGTVETEHFVIHYPETSRFIERREEMIRDHEFRYHQMREFFEVDPVAESGTKIRSFIYEDRDSKGALMGGRDTMVAKLWLHEMHLLWNRTGTDMLAHELAHIFTEPFGAGPLSLSMQRVVGVNMGLVEGIAVAAEWPVSELNPHEATRAMRMLDIDPGIGRLVGAGGFWTEASGPAYTAMGSFVRYLVDEYGIETFKQAYPRGDFEGAYGRSVDELVAEWESFVDDIELTTRQRVVARDRYDRPSIFEVDCARTVAEIRRRARDARSRGAFGEARSEYETLRRLQPNDPSVLEEYVRLLIDHEHFEEALELIEDRPRLAMTRLDEMKFLELKGDIRWSQHDGDGAVRAYGRALRAGATISRERGLRVKRHLAARSEDRGRATLVEQPGSTVTTYLLTDWRRASPDDAFAAYLLGRRLWIRRAHDRAIEHLEAAHGRLGPEVLDAEAGLMLGQSYHFEGRFEEATAVFEGLLEATETYYRESARQWRARSRWAAEYERSSTRL